MQVFFCHVPSKLHVQIIVTDLWNRHSRQGGTPPLRATKTMLCALLGVQEESVPDDHRELAAFAEMDWHEMVDRIRNHSLFVRLCVNWRNCCCRGRLACDADRVQAYYAQLELSGRAELTAVYQGHLYERSVQIDTDESAS